MDTNLASLHAYLCADGYVVKGKNPKHKYYHIGLRNTNLILLKDFQKKFQKVFNLKPHVYRNERCRIGSKEICNKLQTSFGSFYSKDWRLPNINKEQLKCWLRSYFDCEAWVFNKERQNRHIGLDSINETGLLQIQSALSRFNIQSQIKKIKKRRISRLMIYGKFNLINFQKEINFLHPIKKQKLERAINSYVNYNWKISKNLIKQKTRIKKPFLIRITSKLKENLVQIQEFLKHYKIESKIYEGKNGLGTVYYSLIIQKKDSIIKSIKNDLVYKQQLVKIDSKLFKRLID